MRSSQGVYRTIPNAIRPYHATRLAAHHATYHATYQAMYFATRHATCLATYHVTCNIPCNMLCSVPCSYYATCGRGAFEARSGLAKMYVRSTRPTNTVHPSTSPAPLTCPYACLHTCRNGYPNYTWHYPLDTAAGVVLPATCHCVEAVTRL